MRGISRQSLGAGRARVDELTADAGADELRRLAGELFPVVHLLAGEPRLRRIVTDPAVGADQRAELRGGLLGDRVSASAAAVVEVLVRSSWSQPADIVDAADDVAAQVLFAAEERDDALDEVEDELFRFGRILEREPRLRSALTDPSLPAERKQSLLDALLQSKVRETTRVLIGEVVLHPRGRTIDRALEEYGRLAAARRERLVARVRSVVPLTEEQLTRLAEGLAAELGHRVHLNVEIDPDLVGGLTVRIGDELYDASIAHRLAAVRRLMAG
jgi:F-type H+-transporting ATPase subunit delta